MHVRVKMSQQQVRRLKTRLERVINRRGVELDDDLHHDLRTTMDNCATLVSDKYPPGSFQDIFWKQQHHAATLKNSKSMRWEPVMIRLGYYYST
jgi:hypothetical protein